MAMKVAVKVKSAEHGQDINYLYVYIQYIYVEIIATQKSGLDSIHGYINFIHGGLAMTKSPVKCGGRVCEIYICTMSYDI
jgi:hypothetical protein